MVFKRFRMLIKGFCAFCYSEEFGEWPKEFISSEKGKEMKMKFKKHGGKKKKKKK